MCVCAAAGIGWPVLLRLRVLCGLDWRRVGECVAVCVCVRSTCLPAACAARPANSVVLPPHLSAPHHTRARQPHSSLAHFRTVHTITSRPARRRFALLALASVALSAAASHRPSDCTLCPLVALDLSASSLADLQKPVASLDSFQRSTLAAFPLLSASATSQLPSLPCPSTPPPLSPRW